MACCVISRFGPDLEEAHLLDARGLVLAGLDDVVLDGVVDLVVGDDLRRHADRLEGAAPDRRALHAHAQAAQLAPCWWPGGWRRCCARRRRHSRSARRGRGAPPRRPPASAGRRSSTWFQCARSRNRKGASMKGAARLKVDMCAGLTMAKSTARPADMYSKILLLQAERAVLVHDEVHRAAVVLLHQLLEALHGAVEDVLVVELAGAVQRDRRLGADHRGRGEQAGGGAGGAEQCATLHGQSPLGPAVVPADGEATPSSHGLGTTRLRADAGERTGHDRRRHRRARHGGGAAHAGDPRPGGSGRAPGWSAASRPAGRGGRPSRRSWDAPVFESLDALLAAPGLDLVLVLTPPGAHLPVARGRRRRAASTCWSRSRSSSRSRAARRWSRPPIARGRHARRRLPAPLPPGRAAAEAGDRGGRARHAAVQLRHRSAGGATPPISRSRGAACGRAMAAACC